jgi:putative endonuclease
MQYVTYIVECADQTLYIGITTDIERRITEHNTSNKGAKYTRARRPVKLRYTEEFSSKSDAQKREYSLKQLSRPEKLKLVENSQS